MTVSVAYLPRECFSPREKDPHRWTFIEGSQSMIVVRHATYAPAFERFDLMTAPPSVVTTEALERRTWAGGPFGALYLYCAKRDEAEATEKFLAAECVIDAFAELLDGRGYREDYRLDEIGAYAERLTGRKA